MRHYLVIGVALAVSACAPFIGVPDRPKGLHLDDTTIAAQAGAAKVADCLKVNGGGNRTCRNAIVSLRILAIDQSFSEFEADLFRQTREIGFSATVASLGLTGAASLVSGGTANILAAAATALTGTKEAFDKEVLSEQTILAIHTAMRSNRKKILVRIQSGMKQGIADYPLGLALSDLEQYYNAGTVLGALINVTEAAGAEGQAADKKLEELTTVEGFNSEPSADFIINYLLDDRISATHRQNRIKEVTDLYTEFGSDVSGVVPTIFVRDPARGDVTVKVAKRLGFKD